MRMKPNGVIVNVPVEIQGSRIGSARIAEDGCMEIVVLPGALGVEIAERITKGFARGLRIELLQDSAVEADASSNDDTSKEHRDWIGSATQ